MNINNNCVTVICRDTEIPPDRRYDYSRLDEPQNDAARKIEPAINHMLQNVNQCLRISTLSAIAGVSVSQFFLLFKAATGSTPMEFFIRLRMQRACELLQKQDLSVKETAFLLGYNDPCYFSRLFKLVNGIAPRHYRNRILDSPREKSACPSALEQNPRPRVLF